MVPEKKTHAHIPILSPCQNIAIATITTLAQTMVPQKKKEKNMHTVPEKKRHAHVPILALCQNIAIATITTLA